MAEDRESSDRKHEKSKKRDRPAPRTANPRTWTEEDKLQLAEAIDMFGTGDAKRLAGRVRTKSVHQVTVMLRELQATNRREMDSRDMNAPRFVELNAMDDLFLTGGTKPIDVMEKWMNYLESFYGNDYQYDKFKLFSNAFLIISECMPVPDTASAAGDAAGGCDIDFRKVYYYLYRVFNNYYLSKNYKDANMDKFLHDTLLRVLDDIEYSSDNEKIAMHNLVSNWTSVNRKNSVKVYGKPTMNTINKFEEDDTVEIKPTFENTEFKMLPQPMIPSFNPLGLKPNTSSQPDD